MTIIGTQYRYKFQGVKNFVPLLYISQRHKGLLLQDLRPTDAQRRLACDRLLCKFKQQKVEKNWPSIQYSTTPSWSTWRPLQLKRPESLANMGKISASHQLRQDARTSTCHELQEKELKHNTAQGWGWTAHTDTHSSTHTHTHNFDRVTPVECVYRKLQSNMELPRLVFCMYS